LVGAQQKEGHRPLAQKAYFATKVVFVPNKRGHPLSRKSHPKHRVEERIGWVGRSPHPMPQQPIRGLERRPCLPVGGDTSPCVILVTNETGLIDGRDNRAGCCARAV